MCFNEATQKWLNKNCPLIMDGLNNKAKICLPNGFKEFLETGSKNEIETGRSIFLIVEKYLYTLISQNGKKTVFDTYRNELSNPCNEKQLSELFAEIAVCSTIARISSKITLKPLTQKQKHSDFKAIIEDYEIYGEVKRYEDKAKISRRSILTKDDEISIQKTTRPRFQELFSKLKDVNKQLPLNSINIVFLFHSSFGETVKYVKQVLFGESNFWSDKNNLKLEPNSLFSKVEWGNISAFCLCKLGEDDFVEFYEIFRNPNSNNQLPDIVVNKIMLYA